MLRIEDPFRVKNSDEVVAFLRKGELRCCTALSVDVTDLYYSFPQEQLMSSVKEFIAENDELNFRNESGVPVESFLELLSFHLQSTFLLWGEKVMIESLSQGDMQFSEAGRVHWVSGSARSGRNFSR